MKNRPNVRILFGIVLIAFLVTLGRGQETSYPTRIGLSASLQGNEFDILLPIRSEHVEIAPAFGMLWAEDGGSDIHLGVVPRFFLHRDKVAPFIGGRVALLIASPQGGSSTTDGLVGLAFGGEYFLDEHFSFGVESQLNLTLSSDKSARFGNPGKKNLNTAAAVFATVYF